MTVHWNVIKPALIAFVESTGVVGPDHVFWEREAQAIAYEDVIELRISAERAVGFDDVEEVEVVDGATSRNVPRITGIREFTLSIRYSSRNQLTAAREGLETIRACFHHPRLVQTLEEAGIGFLTTEGLQTFDDVSDERWESVAVLDVRLAVVSDYFHPDTDTSVDTLNGVSVSIQGEPPILIEEPTP